MVGNAPSSLLMPSLTKTSAGIKVAILLEELKEGYGKEYTVFVMNGSERETMKHWWIRIAPGGKVPCVIDRDQGRYAITEGHAILNYLTRHYDPALQYSFADPLEACAAEQWISWLHAGLGTFVIATVQHRPHDWTMLEARERYLTLITRSRTG